MGTPVIHLAGLTKRYGGVDALRDLDLDVGEGEVLGFLGPNGAGKTTTVEILEGIAAADDGHLDRERDRNGGLRRGRAGDPRSAWLRRGRGAGALG